MGWPRAAVLLGASLSFTGFLGVTYLTMLAALPPKRRGAWPWVTGLVMAALVAYGPRTLLWWAVRGWAVVVGACFVALTRLRPGAGFISREIGRAHV